MRKMKLALCRDSYTQVYNFYSEQGIARRDVFVPYSLLVLAGHIRSVYGDDVEIRIFDGECASQPRQAFLEDIVGWGPDLIGFTVTTPEFLETLEIVNTLKERLPGCTTVLGGPHITGARPSGTFRGVDYMVSGEGEYPLEEIVAAVRTGRSPARSETIHMHGADADVCQIGDPAYDLIDPHDYQVIDPVQGFVTTSTVFTVRGCPHRCKFCCSSKNFRRRNLDTVIAEIDALYRSGVTQIVINDETLTQNKRHFFDLTERIIALGHKDLLLYGLTRADRITDEIADRLAETNFRRINVGVESGSDFILQRAGKNISVERIKKGVQILRRRDIIVRGSFILGLPYETHQTVRQTIELSKELDIQTAGFNIVMPYPGSELYGMVLRKEGIEFTVDPELDTFYSQFKRWGNSITRTPELSSEDLIEYQKKVNEEFFGQPRIIDFYRWTFEQGNRERYWHRTINEAYRRLHGKDLDYWDRLTPPLEPVSAGPAGSSPSDESEERRAA
jgi:anaerobic magnesium-protoporphyrin IX monomethyl ester cyclase